MEADSDDVEAQVLSDGEKAFSSVHGGSKFHAETAKAGGVVGHDAQEKLGFGVELCDFVQLVGIVKSHLLDAGRLDIANIRVGLAWLSIDDSLRAGSHRKHLLNLSLGGAIKAGAEFSQKAEDVRVRVALDRCLILVTVARLGQKSYQKQLTVERLDSGEILLPSEMLTIDLAKVSDEEGILITRFTELMVNRLCTFVKSLAN